jgi:negative regulator of flagellin synthesis FlgM
VNSLKINRYQPVQSYTNNYQTAKSEEQSSNTSSSLKTNDKVEISTAAKRLQGTQKLEEARQEKIEQIKAQVENGTYHVPSAKIAEKMYGFWNK